MQTVLSKSRRYPSPQATAHDPLERDPAERAPIDRAPLAIPLDIDPGTRWAAGPQPVSFGVWLPESVVSCQLSVDSCRLRIESGGGGNRAAGGEDYDLPVQTEVLSRWPDGSAQWVLVDALLPGKPVGSCQLAVVSGPDHTTLPTVHCQLSTGASAVSVREAKDGVFVETGSAAFHVKRRNESVVCCQLSVGGAGSQLSGPTDHGPRTTDHPQTSRLSTLDSPLADLRLSYTDRRGRVHEPCWDDLRVEARGPVRASVVLSGRIGGRGLTGGRAGLGGRCALRVQARLSFFAGCGLVRAEVTLHNPRRARHHGGIWDLGDRGSVLFREVSCQLSVGSCQSWLASCRVTEAGGEVAAPREQEAGDRRQAAAQITDHGPRTTDTALHPQLSTLHGPFTLYQDSSGGENWNGAIHANREGRIPLRFRGWRAETSRESSVESRVPDAHAAAEPVACSRPSTLDSQLAGLRAEPLVRLSAGGLAASVAVPGFWQEFPKAISADGAGVRVGLFPREFGDLYELQGGERKTHTVWFEFGRAGGADDEPPCDSSRDFLAWVYEPAVVRQVFGDEVVGRQLSVVSGPEHHVLSTVNRQLSTASAPALDRLETLLAEALDGPDNLFARRERADEYGWRNFGDVFADHELQFYRGEQPLVSHYNNQFDMLYGFLLHWLRMGDRRWFELGEALAGHVIDIDRYHTTRDRAAYNGGLFWFTDHYLHAGTSTHRTYSRQNRPASVPYGGGPGPEHNFTTGLLLYHRLTGSVPAREAVIGLAEWVLAMDDGRRNILGVLDDGPTGLASGSRGMSPHAPGRAAGNSINALVDAWELAGDPKYAAHADVLIRRCAHPADDVAALDLLDVEKHWSYTVFLASLAKYLDAKARAAEFDAAYAYARECLVTYARWMAAHEIPYFDQVERLEFPTEAWAAQEFRKANVMRRAAAHADAPLRGQLVARGDELAERAWADLLRFETRTTTRALAVVLVEGLWDCVLRARPEEPPPPAGRISNPSRELAVDSGAREAFVPQKVRIISQARTLRGAARLAARLVNPARWARYCWRRVLS